MAETIWKFTITEVRTVILAPEGARFLTVAEQYGKPQLWARVDDSRPIVVVGEVYLCGTGTEVPADAGAYIGTAICAGGSLVFHAFERKLGGPDAQ